MTEYIDLDTPLEVYVERGGFCTQRLTTLRELLDINKIPYKAADVRPVVLCRDCKRYGGRPWENNESGICARTDVGVGEFDFCSYGEKSEES